MFTKLTTCIKFTITSRFYSVNLKNKLPYLNVRILKKNLMDIQIRGIRIIPNQLRRFLNKILNFKRKCFVFKFGGGAGIINFLLQI